MKKSTSSNSNNTNELQSSTSQPPSPKRSRSTFTTPIQDTETITIQSLYNHILSSPTNPIPNNNNTTLETIFTLLRNSIMDTTNYNGNVEIQILTIVCALTCTSRTETLKFLHESFIIENMIQNSKIITQAKLFLQDCEPFLELYENKTDRYKRLELLYRAYFHVKKIVLTNQTMAYNALQQITDMETLSLILKEANSIPSAIDIDKISSIQILYHRVEREFGPVSILPVSILYPITTIRNPLLVAPSTSRLLRRCAQNSLIDLWQITTHDVIPKDEIWIHNQTNIMTWNRKTNSFQNIQSSNWMNYPILLQLTNNNNSNNSALVVLFPTHSDHPIMNEISLSSIIIQELIIKEKLEPKCGYLLNRPWHQPMVTTIQFALEMISQLEQHQQNSIASIPPLFCQHIATLTNQPGTGTGTTTTNNNDSEEEFTIDFGPAFIHGSKQVLEYFGNKNFNIVGDVTSTHFRIKFNMKGEAILATGIPSTAAAATTSTSLITTNSQIPLLSPQQISTLQFILHQSSRNHHTNNVIMIQHDYTSTKQKNEVLIQFLITILTTTITTSSTNVNPPLLIITHSKQQVEEFVDQFHTVIKNGGIGILPLLFSRHRHHHHHQSQESNNTVDDILLGMIEKTKNAAKEALQIIKNELCGTNQQQQQQPNPNPILDTSSCEAGLLFLNANEEYWKKFHPTLYETSRRLRKILERARPLEILPTIQQQYEYIIMSKIRIVIGCMDDVMLFCNQYKLLRGEVGIKFSPEWLIFDGDIASQVEFLRGTSMVGNHLKRIVVFGEGGNSNNTFMKQFSSRITMMKMDKGGTSEQLKQEISWSLQYPFQIVKVPSSSSPTTTAAAAVTVTDENVHQAEFAIAQFAYLRLHGVPVDYIWLITNKPQQRDLLWRILRVRCSMDRFGLPKILLQGEEELFTTNKMNYVIVSIVGDYGSEWILKQIYPRVVTSLIIYCEDDYSSSYEQQQQEYRDFIRDGFLHVRVGEFWVNSTTLEKKSMDNKLRQGMEYKVNDGMKMISLVYSLLVAST
jgi:hypothetical protein